ncbi:glycosyltransferase [Roseateles oligotrophus]|uniref:Glycosyltransferase n=1 Tax=Roseateles oligotrophus TaxID=1769250 RepID=A0ABT2YDZ6_9BURK|nr:glycosyltransferase [Roseateles oligotrophus]MCV2368270.1 glycosyltransferase [Roseateles oligotrophus]
MNPSRPLKLVLIGDGESPHFLKWARALAQSPGFELWAASSRGFTPEFEALVPAARRYAMNTKPDHGGGNLGLFMQLPGLGAWLKRVDADFLHAHYLTSHGTLAWAARRGWRLRARIIGSAWGSDILVTPNLGVAYRWLTTQVLRACALCTSDSQHMTARMQELGAGEVMTFPFGLEAMPKANVRKQPWLFFANRGLEPIYRPQLVIEAFAALAAQIPEASLVVANDGSLRAELEVLTHKLGLAERVQFVGRLDTKAQALHYARARWYISLPQSDSVSVSVLEAMAHACAPLLSDLPANHELLCEGAGRGLIVDDLTLANLPKMLPARVLALAEQAEAAGANNRAWVAQHGLFAPAVQRFLQKLRQLDMPN